MSDYYLIAAVLVVISILSFTLLMNRKPSHPTEMTDDDEFVDNDLTVTLIHHHNLVSETDFK